jgi:hypothetical protein
LLQLMYVYNQVSYSHVCFIQKCSLSLKFLWQGSTIQSNPSQRSSAFNGHLSYVSSLFLTLCNTFPIKNQSVLNGQLS